MFRPRLWPPLKLRSRLAIPACACVTISEPSLSDTHLADAGYIAADKLVVSRKKGVRLLGPAPKDYQWQVQSGEGFTVQGFPPDWDREIATCPAGHESRS